MSSSAKWTLAFFGVLIALLYFLGPILAPFAASAGLAYLGDPVVDRLERFKLSRTGSVLIVFTALTVAALIVLILLLPLLLRQLGTFIANIPDYLRWLQDVGLPSLGLTLPADMSLDSDNLKRLLTENWSEAGGLAKSLLTALTHSGAALLTFIVGLALVPIVTFYLLRDWDVLVAWIDGMLPLRSRDTVRALARETDEVLSGFLRGQLLVMASLGLIYSTGLWLAGLQVALLIGLAAGLVSFVPYLGFASGLLAASVAILVQTHDFTHLLYVVLAFGVGQTAESMLLTPHLVGHRIGLHPVAVIFSVMAGGQLFGFIGVLLALPTAACIAVLLRHAKGLWLQSDSYLGP